MRSLYPIKLVGDVLTLQYGKPLPESERIFEGGVPAYGANGVLCQSKQAFRTKPSIIVGRKGSAGEVNLTEGAFWPTDVTYYVDYDERVCDLRYLFYALKLLNLQKLAKGVKPGINRNDVYALKIPMPSLPEQKRIVAILDEAFEGIDTAVANAEKNLANVRELFETRISQVFSCGDQWREVSIGEVAQIKGGKRVPKGYRLLEERTPFPYLRVTDFGDTGSIDMSKLRYVSAEVQRQIRAYVIRSEDLYVSIAGTIGRTGIVPKELDGAQLTENACRLVFKPGISNRFVYYFTKTEAFREQAAVNTRTAAQPKLALSRLATVTLRLPAFVEQERRADEFDALREKVEQLEVIYRQKLISLGQLMQAILQKAFMGGLTAQAARDVQEAAE